MIKPETKIVIERAVPSDAERITSCVDMRVCLCIAMLSSFKFLSA